ncbi:hypothetical protein [Bradyrhizobium sp. CCGB01]|uniref:hypothetical protein n=1 Tax=Bradyrhizobium sp. CCGB01 TaxID=2949634 RepID=UPI0020B1DB2B|nr:hypothetical protein [Bradyrhizobium sp. CCGB01]MCP3406210.1 hypothetical protein [Bradyrhizobium sp. CCGB01]
MALLKKKEAAEYRIPSLAEASPEFAALVQKRADLHTLQSKLNGELRDVQKQIDAAGDKGPRVSARIAELLGDEADSAPMLRKQAADIRAQLADVEAALEIVFRRLDDAKGPASTAVCQIVKPEYGKRVAAVAKALEALAEARAGYDDLRNQFEAEDVAWTSLIPLALGFLGDPRDGQIPRFMKEVRGRAMFEKATSKRTRLTKQSRRIKLPGKSEAYADTDPIEIARELRAKSRLGKREARLDAASRKVANGR